MKCPRTSLPQSLLVLGKSEHHEAPGMDMENLVLGIHPCTMICIALCSPCACRHALTNLHPSTAGARRGWYEPDQGKLEIRGKKHMLGPPYPKAVPQTQLHHMRRCCGGSRSQQVPAGRDAGSVARLCPQHHHIMPLPPLKTKLLSLRSAGRDPAMHNLNKHETLMPTRS